MATGFFLLGIAPSMVEMGAAVLDVGYCFQYLISCSLCAYLAKGLNQPPVWIVGTSTACLLAGQLVGTVFEAVAPDQTALAVTVAFVLVLAALYMTSNQNLRRGWGAVSPGSAHKADSGTNEALAVQVLASEHRAFGTRNRGLCAACQRIQPQGHRRRALPGGRDDQNPCGQNLSKVPRALQAGTHRDDARARCNARRVGARYNPPGTMPCRPRSD